MEYRCLGSGKHQRFGDRLQLELLGVTDGPDHEPKWIALCLTLRPASVWHLPLLRYMLKTKVSAMSKER